MCEVGMRVTIGPGAFTEEGNPIAPGSRGLVVGHMGHKWAIISLDAGGTVLVPEGTANVVDRQQRARAVVVHPGGAASVLSRGQTARVRVRPR